MQQFQEENNNISIINNKGFLLLNEKFINNNWYLIKNDYNHIIYTKKGYETELFDIKIDKNKISVSIPVKNSPYQYCTSFNSYYLASEYIEHRLNDYLLS